MNLNATYPRSVRDHVAGVVMLARTTDKAKAKAHGDLGEYHYNCPMDQKLFAFLGIDHAAFLDTVAHAKNDDEIEAFVQPYVAKKSPAEIAAFNAEFLSYGPPSGTDAAKFFHELRSQIAPDRTDVTSWADLLDIDEKRPVPSRAVPSRN